MVFGENQDLIRTHFQKEADKVRAMKTNWGLFTRYIYYLSSILRSNFSEQE